MSKTVRIICIVMAIILLLVTPIYAEESNTYSSAFISSYDSFIDITSGRTMEIWFDVVGTGKMDEIGAESIKLYRSTNRTDWTLVKTFLPEDYPQMICEDTGMNYDCVTYTGSYGYYYKAYVTFYASNSRGRGNEYDYSEVEYLSWF